MKKIFIDAYIANNFGDDLFIEYMVYSFPNIDFYIYGNEEFLKSIKNYKNLSKVKASILDKIRTRIFLNQPICGTKKKLITESDFYLMLGGSIFKESPLRLKYLKQLNRLIKIESIKTLIVGANIESNYSLGFEEEVKKLFTLAKVVILRDGGINMNLESVPSVTIKTDFLLGINHCLKNEEMICDMFVSVVNKKSYGEALFDSYMEYICELIEEAVKRKQKIALVSFCDYEGDKDGIDYICNRFKNEKGLFEIINSSSGTETIQRYLQSAKYVIATRFHSMIMAFVYQKQMIVFPYSNKIRAFTHYHELNIPIANFEEKIDINDFFKSTSIIPNEIYLKQVACSRKIIELIKREIED